MPGGVPCSAAMLTQAELAMTGHDVCNAHWQGCSLIENSWDLGMSPHAAALNNLSLPLSQDKKSPLPTCTGMCGDTA